MKSASNNVRSLAFRLGRVSLVAACLAGAFFLIVNAQNPQGTRGAPPAPTTLGLEQGTLDFETPDFTLKLVKASQTVAALSPHGSNGFDFTPADRLDSRAGDRFNSLGDLTFRVRVGDAGQWQEYSTSAARRPVQSLASTPPVLAAANLARTLPDDCPLEVTRRWLVERGRLVLRFDMKNRIGTPVRIGALGLPMIFNNMLRGRQLSQMQEVNSFTDPAINQDGGYVQVTRLSGRGPALLVVPDGKTPLEAWRPLNEPNGPNNIFQRGNPYEGVFEWMVHTAAYAENEWKGRQPWNPPTMAVIPPGQTQSYGVAFLVAPEIRDIEKTLIENGRPVAVGIPGYILPTDLDAKLFLNYPQKVKSIEIDPARAIAVTENAPTKGGWKSYTLRGKTWGRVRLLVTYDDGTQQAVNYKVIKPASEAVADLGRFLFTRQWFVDPTDPFRRSPSVMTYDRGNNRIVLQDGRAWIAGLGDEGGSGPWLTAAMKLFGQPNREEIGKFEQFIDGVLWGNLQYSEGPRQYGVKKSVFYYDPAALPNFPYDPTINWGSWTSWNKAAAEAVNRAYDYPHVTAAYWSMYRLARNSRNLVTHHPWDWYLKQAFETANYLGTHNNIGNSRDGLMDGTIFLMLLDDLKREGWQVQATALETQLKARAEEWNRRPLPFGSEMAWDSTGQEQIYGVTKYFGYGDKAKITLDSILGYMPSIPNWGYNGNARRFWDFFYGAAPGGTTERQIHHYGSSLNAIPVLSAFRDDPGDLHLLRVGYGGAMGGLSNIDQEGFASAAFHSFPQNMRWDTYSGDYGPNFFGVAANAATYLVQHPEFGWQAFGGNVRVDGDWIKLKPLDAFRRRIFVAPAGLWLELEAGTFDSVEFHSRTHVVRVGLSAADPFSTNARLRVDQPARVAGIGSYRIRETFANERGAFTIPLRGTVRWLKLQDEGR